MTAAHARKPENVVALADGLVEGKAWPIVPDGEYLASYVGHDCMEVRQFRNAPKVFIRFRLFDAGEHNGKVLFRAYRVRRVIDGKRFVLGARSDLLKMVCTVLGQRSRPDRISLRELKHHLLRVRTRTVTKDGDQRELPAAMRYSVVADVLCKETA